MSGALRVAKASDREKTADRLLNSSAEKFYDPEVDMDWNAELASDKYFTLPHRVSLYGTPMWDQLTEDQRIELGRHELASVVSNGIFFEVLLMQMLLRVVYNTDPTTKHVQYALTEIADECRHSTMFGRAVEKLGAPAYGPQKVVHRLGRLMPTLVRGPAMYASILVAEEILDRIQRESMADESVQPLVRMMNRIHVLEEARHVTFARQEVVRGMARLSGPRLAYQRYALALVSFFIVRSLINPEVYRAVGLDPVQARKVALTNPHYQQNIRWAGERIMKFLNEVGLVGGPGMRLWRRSLLLP